MIVAFTGTRNGMTLAQKDRVRELVQQHRPDSICHGDCIGADEQFHEIAITAGVRNVTIRPGHNRHGNTPTRANCHTTDLTHRLQVQCNVLDPEPYLTRDDKIVADGDILIATPKGFREEWRGSGTWGTIRRAYDRQLPIQIVYPDGHLGPYQPLRPPKRGSGNV